MDRKDVVDRLVILREGLSKDTERKKEAILTVWDRILINQEVGYLYSMLSFFSAKKTPLLREYRVSQTIEYKIKKLSECAV